MHDQIEAPAAGAMTQRLDPIKERVRAAFDTLSEATRTVPRMHAELARKLRAPLGKLVSAGQGRDAFDQRVAHIETAVAEAAGLEAPARALAYHVSAQHLVELAGLLEETAKTASRAFRQIMDAADGRAAEAEAGLERELLSMLSGIGRKGLHAATDLSAASEVLGAEAEAYAARTQRRLSQAEVEAADLGWMFALYTMDEERRVHRQAIAQALEDAAAQ